VEHFDPLSTSPDHSLANAAFPDFFPRSHYLFVLLVKRGNHPLTDNLLFP
jgi:hypothetical protein